MTILTADSSDLAGAGRRLLPLWIAVAVYAILLIGGQRLLNDADSLWQVSLGQWIIDHRTVPHTDVYSFTMAGQPWISTQWLAQVLFAASYQLAGWAGPVVIASAATALSFAILAHLLGRDLNSTAVLVFAAAALALLAPHLLARPHVLALPVMVAWVGGLIAAADRRAAPSLWLLPLIALWANLHGGFVLGLALVAPIALDAVVSAAPSRRLPLALRWGGFGVLALIASCANPYGWNALLASYRILSLGDALALIIEWRPADFSRLGPLEVCLLLGLGAALLRGIVLPPVRILLLLGLIHMALGHARNSDVLALLAPLVLARPLAAQIGGAPSGARHAPTSLGLPVVLVLLGVAAGTATLAGLVRFAPSPLNSPAAAVSELKRLGAKRVFNDYDFGGYLIANGVAPFIDGRTELYGERFVVEQDEAMRLRPPARLLGLLDAYKVDATLLRANDAAAAFLDGVGGWKKVYSDEVATIHMRDPGAAPAAAPTVSPTP